MAAGILEVIATLQAQRRGVVVPTLRITRQRRESPPDPVAARSPREGRYAYALCHNSAFSLQPTLTQSAWFRPHNRSEDFENLYFVGAGTHPGAGLPGVLSSAKIAENLICQN